MKKQNFLTLSHDYQMDKTQILGKGSTGEVYLGKQISSGQTVAIKLIRLQNIDNEVTDYLLRMQKIALTTLCHENVLRGLKIIQNATKCYMVTEYCNGGTLKQLIKKQGALTEEKSLEIVKGVLKGYNNLVRKGIIHRDLKPANIMFHNRVPKIIDFGYCEIKGYEKPSLQYNVGSPSYMAPESFENNIYNEKTQIWAIGIILYECLMGKTFDDGKHMSEIFKTIRKFGIPYGKQVSDKCRKIINWCLQFNADKRPTALQLINFLTQKKSDQPEFFILDKNRKKANSLYVDGLEPSNFLTKRKTQLIQKKTSVYAENDTKSNEIQIQTLRRKVSVKEHPKIIMEENERRASRSNSRSKEQYGFISKNSQAPVKVENIPLQSNRQRISSNYMVKNEYGLNQNPVFKTEKYFTGQNIQNKIPTHHISAFNSGLTSPRQMQRKQVKITYQPELEQKNPESGKQRVISKQLQCGQIYKQNPSMTYRPTVNFPQKFVKQTRIPLKKQNTKFVQISKGLGTMTTRHPSEYYPTKPAIIRQLHPCSNYQTITSLNRDRPASSIYEINKYLQAKQKPISIFATGKQVGQKTFR